MGLISKCLYTFSVIVSLMYEIKRSELAVFSAVIEGSNALKEIADGSGLSTSRASELISKLVDKGFLVKKRDGLNKKIYLTETKHCDMLRRLMSSGLKIEDVITDSKLNILMSILHAEKHPTKIAEEANLSHETLRKYFRELKKRGVIYSIEDRIRLSPSYPLLTSFIEEYASYLNRKVLMTMSVKGVIVWEMAREMIFKVPIDENVRSGVPTAITALSKYGIDILSEFSYYYYAPWVKSLRCEDIAVHTILLEDDSTRYLSYALLLLKKEGYDVEYLAAKGNEYGLIGLVRDLINYLNGNEVEGHLPSHDDFRSLCAQYGVE